MNRNTGIEHDYEEPDVMMENRNNEPIVHQPNIHQTQQPRHDLEILSNIDELNIEHVTRTFTLCICPASQSIFTFRNANERFVFKAVEDDEGRSYCCQCKRPQIKILDELDRPIMLLDRTEQCNCLQFATHITNVYNSSFGTLIGCVERHMSWCSEKFLIKDVNDQVILKVHYNLSTLWYNFKIYDMNNKVVGVMKKVSYKTSPYCLNSNAQFPMEFDVNTKALLMAAFITFNMILIERYSDYNN